LKKLVINLATRGRADLCIETLQRTLPNIAEQNTLLIVSLDHDDPESIKKLQLFALDHKNLIVDVRKREDSFGEKYNRMLEWDADVYMGMVDYGPQVTPGFDKIILEASQLWPDGIGAVYAHYMPNGSFTCLNAATKTLVQKMGFYYPPWFPYWFVDHWFDDICRMTDRYCYVPIKVDILKRPGTQDRRDCAFWATLFDALYLRRRKQAVSIINDPEFQEPEWRKKVLISRIPLVEHRSRLVNDSVRNLSIEPVTGIPDDERYTRIKATGKALLRELIAELEQTEERA
jgi:hypothetical protein